MLSEKNKAKALLLMPKNLIEIQCDVVPLNVIDGGSNLFKDKKTLLVTAFIKNFFQDFNLKLFVSEIKRFIIRSLDQIILSLLIGRDVPSGEASEAVPHL